MSLRDLDERLVPRIAAGLDRVARLFPKTPEPSGPLPVILRLRRLDDRWTAAGPLALLRDVPQLGAVAIGALVLASGITVAGRTRPEATAPPGTEQSPGAEAPAGDGALGPQIGENVPAYIDDANDRLRELGEDEPDGTVVAVISFTAYRTPEQVRDLAGPLQVRQVFYRVPMPLPQGIVRTAEVDDVVVDARREFERVAKLRSAESKELAKVAATIEGDPAQKREHELDARLYANEAASLRGPCACVFGVVVRARLRLLLDLLGQSGVRVVDVSEVDAHLDHLTYTALLPEEKITVTGGNQE